MNAPPTGRSAGVAPRAILFDWDNTLVDSWATIHEALNFLLRAMARPEWSLAETQARVRLSLREAFPLHFGARWEEARDIYLEHFRTIHLDRLQALPGRDALLRHLAGQGVYLGIVSNKTGELLRREVTRLGWSALFGSIVGAGDATADKPACEPVHLALAPSGIAAGEEVWFVGDTDIDMECARNSGCIAVLLGDGGVELSARCAPHLSFADDASLFRALQGLRFNPARPSS
ncbi:MAG TPA: HAD family hydrolase [Stellaceae bacterium]|nr:HAD family hydrolase [Stellaceae bacterium]